MSTHRASSPPVFFRRALLLALAACLLGQPTAPVRADIQQPPRATSKGEREVRRRGEGPAAAVARKAQVELDGRVDIILEGYGTPGKTIDFFIRTPPAHGALTGPPRQLTRESAVVTYVHRGADGAQADEFTYAVQTRGTGVSAAVTVKVDVADVAPELAASPAELDFGAVKAGDSSRAQITLENRGGGIAVGRLMPPSPWEVEGTAEYRLARGARQTFSLVFRPAWGESFLDNLRLGGEEVRLIGTGLGDPMPQAAGRPALAATAAPGSGAAGPAGSAGTEGEPGFAAMGAPGTAGTRNAPPGTAGALPPGRTGSSGAVAAAPISPGAAAANVSSGPDGPASAPQAIEGGTIYLNRAMVGAVNVVSTTGSTAELSWTPPTPLPRSYRVEMRHIVVDPDAADNPRGYDLPPRMDWRPYGQSEIRAEPRKVTARLKNLTKATIYALRVVSVDRAGQLAAPSPVVFAETTVPSSFWTVTPLKALVAVLLVLGAYYAYRRWETRRILASIDEGRHARRAQQADEPVAWYD